MEEKRAAIKLYHDKGFQPSEIIKQLNLLSIGRSLVYRTVKRLRETGSTKDRPRSGRPRSARTPALKKKVYQRIYKNPRRSARKLARQLNTSRSTIRRIIDEDLGLHPYKKRKVPGLTAAKKKKRLDRSKALFERFPSQNLENLVFSDEKLFNVEESLNSQNDRIYAATFEDIPEEMRNVQRFQHPSSVMVWAAVSKKGKFRLAFVEPGVKVNKEYYQEHILNDIVKEEGKRIFKNGHWIFQQDSAPAHKAKINQEWCAAQIPEFISSAQWPPSSPDLNPMDYAIWGILESKVNVRPHRSLDSLKSALQREWDNLSMDIVRKSIDAFPKRLKAVIRQKGGRFE